MLKPNDYIFIKACNKQSIERTPLWVMRQAGRYLPEYRAMRQKHDFLTMCKTPELASEVTLQPIDIFDFDASIIFSDILVIPEAMGMKLQMVESRGPVFEDPIRSEKHVENLKLDGLLDKLKYVFDAVKLTKIGLKNRVPLIGFSGAPWTLASYMVEGKGSKNFEMIKSMIFSNPALAHKLLNKITNAVIQYLNQKVVSGCDAIQIFDTWAGLLSPWDYEEFSLQYIKRIIAGIENKKVPVILFAKGAHSLLRIADSGCNVVGIDWTVDIGEANSEIGDKVAIQGNLDPLVLFAKADKIYQDVELILSKFGNNNGHIFNLGHGILPKTPVENVKVLIQAVKELSPKYHE